MGFDVVEQVHAEVVEAQVGDGHAGLQVFQLDHFLLQAAQLLLAVGHVVGLGGQHVVVAGGVTSAIIIRLSTRSLRLMYSSSEMSGQ
jgi:hypothetical protein